jgi:hypothetical protein
MDFQIIRRLEERHCELHEFFSIIFVLYIICEKKLTFKHTVIYIYQIFSKKFNYYNLMEISSFCKMLAKFSPIFCQVYSVEIMHLIEWYMCAFFSPYCIQYVVAAPEVNLPQYNCS